MILARNFRSRFGEIDIVARDEKYLCFTEVKTRRGEQIAMGREAVTLQKQRRIIKTAEYYIAKNRGFSQETDLQPRFDCAEVVMKADFSRDADFDFADFDISYIENAFE